MKVVQASTKDKKKLDEIACKSKQFWNYPDAYIKLWLNKLKVKKALLEEGRIYKAIDLKFEILGFYGLEGLSPTLTLEGFWVSPDHMKKGVGKRLFSHMIKTANTLDAKVVRWESDPNAASFYLKMGAKKVGEKEYLLDNKKRILPVMQVDL